MKGGGAGDVGHRHCAVDNERKKEERGSGKRGRAIEQSIQLCFRASKKKGGKKGAERKGGLQPLQERSGHQGWERGTGLVSLFPVTGEGKGRNRGGKWGKSQRKRRKK